MYLTFVNYHFLYTSIFNKTLGLGDFYEKNNNRDDVGLPKKYLSNARFRDDTWTHCKESRDNEEYGLRYSFGGESPNIFSTKYLNRSGLIVDNDRDGQMAFDCNELEDFKGQKLYQSVNGSSYNVPPASSSSALSKKRSLPNHSSPVDLNMLYFSWLNNQTVPEHDTLKHSIRNVAIQEDSDKKKSRKDLKGGESGTSNFMSKNNGKTGRNSSKLVASKRKRRHVSIAAVSATRHKHWTEEEDEILRSAIAEQVKDNVYWNEISRNYFRLTRSATQCKNRWKNVS